MRILIVAVYNASGNSIAVASFSHAMVNEVEFFFPIYQTPSAPLVFFATITTLGVAALAFSGRLRQT